MGCDDLSVGVVVIGRNEGERLRRCLQSLSFAATVVYVDSGSMDGSTKMVRDQGVEVIELDASLPFTAARARNVGFRRLREVNPDIRYVQFVDGDCELNEDWPQRAHCFLDGNPDVGAVLGRLVERYPERSIFN